MGKNIALKASKDVYAEEITNGRHRIVISAALRDRTPAPQGRELAEAEVVWGQSASFSWGSAALNKRVDPVIYGKHYGGVNWPDYGQYENPDQNTDPENALPPVVDEWTEIARVERTVRINGPDGAYVDVARLDEITWQLPDLPGGQKLYVVQKYQKFGDG